MAVRWYAAITALAALAFLWYAADHAGLVRLPWRPAPEAGLQSALVRATQTIDLESGKEGAARADLHWGMQARDQPYLGAHEPQRSPEKGALIAQAGTARWEDLNDAALGKLSYASNRFSAWGPEAPVRKGAVFAVRTAEGNFAKIRVVDIRRNHDLELEWVLFARAKPAPPAQAVKETAKAAVNPPLAWLALRDEALAAHGAQRYQDALDACGKAVAAAREAGAAHHALALVTCGGLTGLHRRAASQIEDWLRQGVAIALKLEQGAIVAALGPHEAMLKERGLRTLGVFYRDQNRPREAAENFALAVDTVRAMPPPETGEHRLALRSDLYDLGVVLAQIGLRGTARQALGEAREYYLKTAPGHSMLKEIDGQLQRLERPAPEPAG
jgi:hypothetical protein